MKSPPRGFVLPFVLIALAASGLLAFSLASGGWQSARAVSLAGQGDAAANAAEEAEALAMTRWYLDSLWSHPLHAPVRRAVSTQLGQVVDVIWTRPHPLVAWLQTRYVAPGHDRRSAVHRELLRAVWLQPPPFPVVAALAVPGEVTGAEGTLISGSDLPTPGSACGLTRDTVSVGSLRASTVAGEPLGGWPGAPAPDTRAWVAADTMNSTLGQIRQRAAIRIVGPTPEPLPPSTGWSALWLTGSPVIIQGPTKFTGLLVVDGPLELRGHVSMEGLLIVRGALDARAARWQLQGAAVSTDTVTGNARLGSQSRIFYDRCAVQMALATVARPLVTPFSLWQPLSR